MFPQSTNARIFLNFLLMQNLHLTNSPGTIGFESEKLEMVGESSLGAATTIGGGNGGGDL